MVKQHEICSQVDLRKQISNYLVIAPSNPCSLIKEKAYHLPLLPNHQSLIE